MRQLTKQEAIAFYDERKWESMTPIQRASFQLHQDRLCMPMDVFQESLQNALGRPVYQHEFIRCSKLIKELEGKKGAPTMEALVEMIPADKLIILVKE